VDEGALLIGFIVVERLVELVVAQRNTARLRAAGAIEFGRAHYPFIVLVHATWLIGLWWLARDHAVDRALLAIFIVLQAARIWIIASLGARWTTRVIVLPGAPLVAAGPYRLIRHPNYLLVILEIAVVPLALGLPLFAFVFSLLNAAILWQRIRTENIALAWAASEPVRRPG
jgi:methyltransferase